MADGSHTAASAVGSGVNGPATLSGVNCITIAIPYTAGVFAYQVYRTASGGTPATLGVIAATNETGVSPVPAKLKLNMATTVTDTGYAGDTTTAPTSNTTGVLTSTVPTGLVAHMGNQYSYYLDKTLTGNGVATDLFWIAIADGDQIEFACNYEFIELVHDGNSPVGRLDYSRRELVL